MKRSAVREHVFRILFRYEFHKPADFEEQVSLYFEEAQTDEDEFYIANIPDELGMAEIKSRAILVSDKLSEIDEKLSEVCENWKLDRIGKTELSILRLAAYEILFDDDIQTPVAINEAVELAKKYCDDKSHSFVNGVLARFVK